jgi:hypothetical protein
MTFIAAGGYFAIIGGKELLDRLADSVTGPGRASAMLRAFANERWVWITPLVVVLVLYLSVIFQPGQAETGPVMYALF